jgi:serine/threonine protein kinase
MEPVVSTKNALRRRNHRARGISRVDFRFMNLPRPFGPYTLLRRLAVGGMAEIYVAKTRGLGGFEKLVAIKLVHPHLSADPHFVRMLIDEAKILVLLTHANIAQVFDLGCIDGTYYIAMEFVEGMDIHGLQKAAAKVQKPLPVPVCCYIVAEMLNGLDYAQRKRDHEGKPLNIVHRDISPQNVLISQAGEVKLVDFGIAKTNLRGEGTEVGVIKGKYYYMSPEQAWADPMDRRSDIFSTGIVLYEMLTGRMLYAAQSIPELISKVREAQIDPPETLRSDIPPELSKIVMKALARDVKHRYQSSLDMGEALRDFLYATAPSFNAARLAQFVTDLLDEEGKIAEGKNAEATGKLRALTREDFVRSENSVIFALADVLTRNEVLPVKGRKNSGEFPQVSARPPANMQHSLPPGFASPSSLPKLRVPMPPPGKVTPGKRGAALAHEPIDSAPPTEVMTQPPELKRMSAWPLESTRPSDPPPDEPTELWQGNPLRANTNDETLIDSELAFGVANTEMMRAAMLDQVRMREELEPTSKYNAAHASEMLQSFSGNDARPALSPLGTPALMPPPGDGSSFAPIPPSPPIPDFGPQDKLFRTPPPTRSFTHVVIGLAFMVLGVIAFQLIRQRKPEPQLEIVSVPAGAKVSVDQRVQNGVTPLRISGLESGRSYDLRVELSGYLPWEATYHASPGAVRHIAVLKPITGEVHVASVPSGADVWLDGVPIGRTPLTVSSLTVGRHVKLRVGHLGYTDVRREIIIEESNLKTELKLVLTKEP